MTQLLALICCLILAPISVAAATGDECADPIDISLPGLPGAVSVDVDGTTDGFTKSAEALCGFPGPDGFCNDVWYKTDAVPAGTEVLVSLWRWGGSNDFFPLLSVYMDCGGAAVACDPSSFSATSASRSTLKFEVPTTGSLLIRVAGYDAFGSGCESGSFTMVIRSPIPILPGDECVDAFLTPIPGAPFSGSLDLDVITSGFFSSADWISCSDDFTYCNDVWYKTQDLPANTLVTLSFNWHARRLAVYSGCGGTELACVSTPDLLGSTPAEVYVLVPATGPLFIRFADGAIMFGPGCKHNNQPTELHIQTGCASVCDDPHFKGLNGVRYNFQGEPDKTFAIVSDSNMQLNSRFIAHWYNGTLTSNLGPTCIRTCSENITLLPTGELHVNGKRLFYHEELAYRSHHYRQSDVTYLTKTMVEVVLPGQWKIVLQTNGRFINLNNVIPLGSGNKTITQTHPDIHGVLGHTLGAPVLHEHKKCNSVEEGGCAVTGEFQDYEVDGDLCSAEWTHRRFTC